MKTFLLKLIGIYQGTASVRRARCRFHPTCSQYAAEAIESHGARRGVWLALKRLAKCQPFGSFGFDPVPEPAAPGATVPESAALKQAVPESVPAGDLHV